jgi:hypothetical protein
MLGRGTLVVQGLGWASELASSDIIRQGFTWRASV